MKSCSGLAEARLEQIWINAAALLLEPARTVQGRRVKAVRRRRSGKEGGGGDGGGGGDNNGNNSVNITFISNIMQYIASTITCFVICSDFCHMVTGLLLCCVFFGVVCDVPYGMCFVIL